MNNSTFEFDPLLAFADWYRAQPFSLPPAVADGVRHVGGLTGLTVYRQGQFQVQLWIAGPNVNVPDHCHPSIDTIQVYVSGQCYMRLNGQELIDPEAVKETENGTSSNNGFWMRARPTELHGALFGPQGGAFLALQHWINGVPTSADEDWDGLPIDAAHGLALGHLNSPNEVSVQMVADSLAGK